MIRKETAQKIASYWHDGQWSALYQFSSSGVFVVANTLQYLKEVQNSIQNEFFAPYPQELTKGQERELESLKAYFIDLAKQNGIGIEFLPHDLYGYMIPYITEETPDETANQVQVISYLK